MSPQPVLGGLYDTPAPDQPAAKPFRKIARAVSKETYNVLADTGALGAMCTKVLRSLKAYINRYQNYPTPSELTRFMFTAGTIPRDDVRLVAPRLTEMSPRGKVVKQEDGSRVRVGGAEIELLSVRRCTITGRSAHPVKPRDKGSLEPRTSS